MAQVWLVTGAASGIGAATVRAALAAGHRVVAAGRRLDRLQAALAGVAGERLDCVALDVTDAAAAERVVAAAVARHGRLDVLVNNAGYSLLGNYEEFSRAEIDAQFDTNFHGVSNLMRAVLPTMRRQRAGLILNVSSVAGVIGMRHCGAYSATKFAVEGLSQAVAQEVAPFGIRISVVEPGFFRTDLLAADSARYPALRIDDYAAEGPASEQWSGYHGQQGGDPARLGRVLVQLAAMPEPPALFVAGSDALALITPAVEARLAALRAHEALSRSSDFPAG